MIVEGFWKVTMAVLCFMFSDYVYCSITCNEQNRVVLLLYRRF